MIPPINACELDAGRPRNQVPRFQAIAESKIANTIAIPAREPIEISKSTGSRLTTANATAVPPRQTPRKLQRPDRITADRGVSDLV